MRSVHGADKAPNFLDKENPHFKRLHAVTDHHYRNLRKSGVGATTKQILTFTRDEEEKLWQSGVLGISSPQALQNAIFFLNGKSFALRGISEQYNLKVSQLQRETNPDRYVYVEHGFKNRSGGIADYKVPNKQVPIYANPIAGPRCHVYILDMYLQKLPSNAKINDIFYMRPLSFILPNNSSPWYHGKQRLGKNSIGRMVSQMCENAGLPKRTDHSLRATCVTQLFEAGVPNNIIQARTGHRTLSSLHLYERISDHQQ